MKTNEKLIAAIIILLMLFSQLIHAQDEKKVKIKIIKEVDGKTTIIDTLIIGKDLSEIYMDGLNLDEKDMEEILENLEKIDKSSASRIYLFDSEKIQKGDSLKNILVEITEDIDSDKEHVYIISSDDKRITKKGKQVIYIGNDEECDTIIGKGDSKIIIKNIKESDDDNAVVWISSTEKMKAEGDSLRTYFISSKSGKCEGMIENYFTITTEAEELNDNEKSYKVIVKSNDEGTFTIITDDIKKKDEGDMEAYAYYINDGKKVVVLLKGLDEDDMKMLTEIKKNVSSEDELKDAEIKISYKVKSQQIFLEFDVDQKANLKVDIFDRTGKNYLSDNQKGFSGKYSKEIDLPTGQYYIQISHDKKTATKKLSIK